MDRHGDRSHHLAPRSRWEGLFDDLEAQLRTQEERDAAAERAEYTRAVWGEVRLSDRLVASTGQVLRIQVHGHGSVEGLVGTVGNGWLVLTAPDLHSPERTTTAPARPRWVRHWLIPEAAVLAVRGLSGRSDPHPGLSQRRLDIRSALRAISRDRSAVRVSMVDGGRVTGTIDRVGRDHLELSEHPEDLARRSAAVRDTVVIAHRGLACVISAAERAN